MTFEQWLQSLTTEQRYDFDSEGRGYPKPKSHMMHLAWNAATAPLLERIAELEAKLAQRVPEWNGLVEGERDQIVTDICEYGTGFVAPLYAIVEGIERKLMERNAAPAAPEQAPNAQQAEAQEPVLFVSPAQLAAHKDIDEGEFGIYLPAGKTAAGKFTQPLFTRPQPAQLQRVSNEEVRDAVWGYVEDASNCPDEIINIVDSIQSALAAKNGAVLV